jgi:hypothetical protein
MARSAAAKFAWTASAAIQTGTFREHSRKIQGTFKENSVNIQ